MSPWTRYIASLVAGLVVTVWAWWHGGFNGANVLVIAVLAFAAIVLWLRENAEDRAKPRDTWIDPKDGV